MKSNYHKVFIGECVKTNKPTRVYLDFYAIAKVLDKSPEIEHSIKKLWGAGGRNGGKSYRQDLTEARNQIDKEIEYLDIVEELGEWA